MANNQWQIIRAVSTQYNKIFVNLGRRRNQALSYSASGARCGLEGSLKRFSQTSYSFETVWTSGAFESSRKRVSINRIRPKTWQGKHRGVRPESGPVSVVERLRCSRFEVAGYLRYLSQMLIGSGHDQNVPGFDFFIFSWMEE